MTEADTTESYIRLPGSTLPPPPDGPKPLVFDGDAGEFFRIAAKGAALQLVTFGFYRFWLVTDIRRHLWSRTSLDGDRFEYTGYGRELLIGFLFALAILSPIYLAYFLLGLEAERYKAFASIPLFLFFYLFQQFAVYRARRYRLTRTIWRGVRFWMAGSGWSYALRSFGWMLLTVLTFGLMYPWRAAALERYKMRHTHYGELQGSFVATGGQLFARVWMFGLIILAPIALIIASAVVQYRFGERLTTHPTAGMLLAAAGIVALAIPVLWPLLRAVEWRWWTEGVRFGDVFASSALRKRTILVLYVKFILSAMLVAALAGAIITAVVAGLASGYGLKTADLTKMRGEWISYVVSAGIVLAYLVVGLAVGAIQRYFLQRGLWAEVARATTIEGVQKLEAVGARGDAANALGEGLADGLDVAGF